MPRTIIGGGLNQTQVNSLIASALANQQSTNPSPAVTTATPTTGNTVTITDDNRDRLVVISPVGTIAALTITLPSDANSRLGQLIELSFTQVVTLVTINGATTIRNTITTAAIGDHIKFRKVAANTWHRAI